MLKAPIGASNWSFQQYFLTCIKLLHIINSCFSMVAQNRFHCTELLHTLCLTYTYTVLYANKRGHDKTALDLVQAVSSGSTLFANVLKWTTGLLVGYVVFYAHAIFKYSIPVCI